MAPIRRNKRWLALVLGLLSVPPLLSAAELVSVPALGLRVARGFRVRLYADETLAPDVSAMTLNAQGNVVITGPGYIRTLYDTDNNGFADRFVNFAEPRGSGMGLEIDGQDLYYVGDGGLWRFVDANGDGMAEGRPQKLLTLATGEHGGHAIRKGPDGWWYLIAGNEAGIGRQNSSTSPITEPVAGALLRMSPDFQRSEVIAHGLRNPCDFVFNTWGDLLTCDADAEQDFLLPWYTDTRILHLAYGEHQGSRVTNRQRGWHRPPYYVDVPDPVTSLGRGAPTGLVCYRHYQFPLYFRNGLFTLDWSFGRVSFVTLQANLASLQGTSEIFVEPLGVQGFAPTDIAVGPDGDLFISAGGRGTGGGVYRVDYVANAALRIAATNWLTTALTEVRAVLTIPQPDAEWSRAYWVPVAERLSPIPFDAVAADDRVGPEVRVRAIEILTALHGGLSTAAAGASARASSSLVRERAAWSLGRIPCANYAPILLALAKDTDPAVRRAALEAILERKNELSVELIQEAIAANVAHIAKPLRLAAAHLAVSLPPPAWTARWGALNDKDSQARLTAILASLWRAPQNSVQTQAIAAAVSVLAAATTSPDQRLQALRLIMLGFGDWQIASPSLEVYSGAELAGTASSYPTLVEQTLNRIRAAFPADNATLNVETSRLLAMLRDSNADTPKKVISLITESSPYDLDLHYLIVFSRLNSGTATNLADKVASALLELERKVVATQYAARGHWTERLVELTQVLLNNDPRLADTLVHHHRFPAPGNLWLVPLLGPQRRVTAARAFEAAMKDNPQFPWSPELIDLLGVLPHQEIVPLFRRQWVKPALREDLLLKLAENPEVIDRDKFIWGLSSSREDVLRASQTALTKLPPDASGLLAAMRLLDRLLDDPPRQLPRAQALAVVNHMMRENLRVTEQGTDPFSLRQAYAPVLDTFTRKYAALARQLRDPAAQAATVLENKLRTVDVRQGDAQRGALVFEDRGCQSCHTGTNPIGPNLADAAARLTPAELLRAIAFPQREVAPPFRVTVCQTRSGQTFSGYVAHEAPDVVLLRTGPATTVRLLGAAIASRQVANRSLMPEHLLDKLSPRQIADLHAYVRSLAR